MKLCDVYLLCFFDYYAKKGKKRGGVDSRSKIYIVFIANKPFFEYKVQKKRRGKREEEKRELYNHVR